VNTFDSNPQEKKTGRNGVVTVRISERKDGLDNIWSENEIKRKDVTK